VVVPLPRYPVVSVLIVFGELAWVGPETMGLA